MNTAICVEKVKKLRENIQFVEMVNIATWATVNSSGLVCELQVTSTDELDYKLILTYNIYYYISPQ